MRIVELVDAFLPSCWGLVDKRPCFVGHLKPIYLYLPLGAIVIAQTAFAADADDGKRLALLRCAPCHIVIPNLRNEVADSPPFDTIAKKFGSNFELLYSAVRDPHPRMNMVVTRQEAEDIAAYISLLAK
jgi:mono/diheme cytochrome c family protein